MCVCTCQPPSVKNPNQLDFGFKDTRFPDSYDRGFESGINWDANWMPGGPFVYAGKNGALREADEVKYKVWHEGFNAGLKLRLETNPHFAAWWHENRKPGAERSQRYTAPEASQ